jgi:hypothetical protein
MKKTSLAFCKLGISERAKQASNFEIARKEKEQVGEKAVCFCVLKIFLNLFLFVLKYIFLYF